MTLEKFVCGLKLLHRNADLQRIHRTMRGIQNVYRQYSHKNVVIRTVHSQLHVCLVVCLLYELGLWSVTLRSLWNE